MNATPNPAPRWKRGLVELVERGPILTLAEVDERYPGEWVLLLVTKDNKQIEKIEARVLTHNRSRGRLTLVVLRMHNLYPRARLFPHLAGPRPTIEEFRRRILEGDFPEEVLRAWW